MKGEFVIDGREGAEFEAGNVSEDRSATGGDAVLDEETGELGQEVVDLGGRAEVGRFVAECRGEISIDDLGVGLRGCVAGAEVGIWVAVEEAATGVVRELVLATMGDGWRSVGEERVVIVKAIGVSGWLSHFDFPFEIFSA